MLQEMLNDVKGLSFCLCHLLFCLLLQAVAASYLLTKHNSPRFSSGDAVRANLADS